jgi:hypothetical protein
LGVRVRPIELVRTVRLEPTPPVVINLPVQPGAPVTRVSMSIPLGRHHLTRVALIAQPTPFSQVTVIPRAQDLASLALRASARLRVLRAAQISMNVPLEPTTVTPTPTARIPREVFHALVNRVITAMGSAVVMFTAPVALGVMFHQQGPLPLMQYVRIAQTIPFSPQGVIVLESDRAKDVPVGLHPPVVPLVAITLTTVRLIPAKTEDHVQMASTRTRALALQAIRARTVKRILTNAHRTHVKMEEAVPMA